MGSSTLHLYITLIYIYIYMRDPPQYPHIYMIRPTLYPHILDPALYRYIQYATLNKNWQDSALSPQMHIWSCTIPLFTVATTKSSYTVPSACFLIRRIRCYTLIYTVYIKHYTLLYRINHYVDPLNPCIWSSFDETIVITAKELGKVHSYLILLSH